MHFSNCYLSSLALSVQHGYFIVFFHIVGFFLFRAFNTHSLDDDRKCNQSKCARSSSTISHSVVGCVVSLFAVAFLFFMCAQRYLVWKWEAEQTDKICARCGGKNGISEMVGKNEAFCCVVDFAAHWAPVTAFSAFGWRGNRVCTAP